MAAVKRLAIPALALAVVLMAGLSLLAQVQKARPLSEADLTKLIELQVGDDVVIARVGQSGVAFSVDAAALERLRNAGASEPVLAAVQKAGQPANAITYEGILKLVQQGTNEDEILKRLQGSPTTFTLDATQTAELERAGASPRLLQALLQLRNPPVRGSDINDFVVILDCSGSMKELTPERSTKMDAAKQVVTRFLRAIPEGKRLAFIVYGISPIKDKAVNCQDVQVVQPLAPLDAAAKERLSQYISGLQPFGWTPLALSLETAGRELSGSQGLCQLVVVTDGMETCDGNPGQVATELTRKLSLPHGVDVIGFGVAPQEKAALQAIVDKRRGHYYDAGTAEELGKALQQAKREAEQEVDKTGLVAFYTFDDGTARDVSGNGNNGTLSPNPPNFIASGYQRWAFSYESARNNFITIPVDINPGVMPQITIGGWFNASAESDVSRGLISHDDGRYINGCRYRNLYIFKPDSSDRATWSATADGTDWLNSGSPAEPNRWTFVAMTHDQNTGRLVLWVDGGHFAATKVFYESGLDKTTIGRNPNNDAPFYGRIDNVFIFSSVLSDAQISDIRVNGAKSSLFKIHP
jgi:Mg-chelatase subunit ChlD